MTTASAIIMHAFAMPVMIVGVVVHVQNVAAALS